jgi:opacity protein-like surface antigen
MLKNLLCFLFLTSLSITSAQALVFIEPVIGYANGSLKIDASDTTGSGLSFKKTLKVAGVNYGIKGGLDLDGFQLGLEYMSNRLKVKNGGEDFKGSSFNVNETSLLMGYHFSYLRAYGGYIFSAKEEETSALKSNGGFKAGMSFYVFQHLALSLEYRTVDFKSYVDDGILMKTKYNTLAMLVSFPFGI